MFLFTTPAAPTPTPSPDPAAARGDSTVVDAIRAGSERTGADFGYLLQTARRESSLDPAAKARSSSASGLFQFIEQTWLGVVKGVGAEHGLARYAEAITEVKPGRYDVPDPQTKAQILSLRNDPQTAAVMAGEFTRRNGQALAGMIGRQPTEGELYVAHFMGAAGAADLIRAAQARPAASAADLFPDQAATNRSVFYDKATGRPHTVSELYAALTASAPASGANAKLPADPATWRATASVEEPMAAPAYAHADGPALHGLFRTEGRRGPLNQVVQRLWSSVPARAAADSPGFFPRTASLQGATASDAPVPGLTGSPGAGASVSADPVPLPPPRPASLESASALDGGAGARGARKRAPLDLLAFLKPKGAR